ncbi:hypothetical protein [Enterobacter kobei]|uniref:hypothetical protein n=1 Tax=Enterobacter kobei TaxID=208224 RepID=UPI0021493E50|nr:hypothetical protein [Enterobacter kobei]MCR1298369.1 hypothetical protein [Enterobacter kobei]
MTKYFTAGTTPPGFFETRPEIDSVEITDELWQEMMTAQAAGRKIIAGADGMPVLADIPVIPNSELLKAALAALSTEYQADIEILNRAWLGAAVNGGVNETTKKDAVLVQINARKTKYATDRAAVIAQYPV